MSSESKICFNQWNKNKFIFKITTSWHRQGNMHWVYKNNPSHIRPVPDIMGQTGHTKTDLSL